MIARTRTLRMLRVRAGVLLAGALVTGALLAGEAAGSVASAQEAAREPVLVEQGSLRCADGVVLEHSVVRPAEGRVPALLVRTPYSRAGALGTARRLAERGIAVMVQDCRGTGGSKGSFLPFVNETVDGRQAWDWLKSQDWCDGRTGTYGMSYLGITQWRLMADPQLQSQAMLLQFTSSDLYRDLLHFGGAQSLAIGLSWALGVGGGGVPRYRHLPLIEADDASGRDLESWNAWTEHEALDEYWQRLDLQQRRATLHAPALLVAGWYDLFLPGQVRDYAALAARPGPPEQSFARLIVGPWDHAGPGASGGRPDLGPAAYGSTDDEERLFLDRFLLGEANGYESRAGVRAFFLGENRWHELDAWPPSAARRQDFFLHSFGHAADVVSDGVLTTRPPARSEPQDLLVYDPEDPTPSFARDLWAPLSNLRDQAEIGLRPDVLCYATLPLRTPLRFAGPMSLCVHLSTDVTDTDIAAKVVSIEPDGTSHWRGEGILRARYRDGFEQARPLPIAEAVEMVVDLGPMACVIPPGHRLGLQIASANFPRFARNLGVFEPNATAQTLQIARHQILHTPEQPSRLSLWVLDEAGDPPPLPGAPNDR